MFCAFATPRIVLFLSHTLHVQLLFEDWNISWGAEAITRGMEAIASDKYDAWNGHLKVQVCVSLMPSFDHNLFVDHIF